MPMLLNPYFSFRDTAEEAMTFYRSVFGGELSVSRFSEYGASDDPAEQDKVMHSMLTTGTGMVLMAADTPNSMDLAVGENVSVSVSGDDESVMCGWWEALGAGGTVTMPLEEAPWGGLFGMCTDRFGIHWMFSVGDAGS
ncbi:VOC family protein [Kocuria sp. UCD-OTCP]|uniref:VOC family protein n=1 Tax=Kocuria sp. UCD-OTCP TaxID=1292021 RepID=UPI000379D306|nr:VOC family protein [Kocuria sp. UCD-OTCP]EYT48099.1 3-demethylubiquinone-9 3-methyltransferase [Kocuria sp. UCD-OTCP]